MPPTPSATSENILPNSNAEVGGTSSGNNNSYSVGFTDATGNQQQQQHFNVPGGAHGYPGSYSAPDMYTSMPPPYDDKSASQRPGYDHGNEKKQGLPPASDQFHPDNNPASAPSPPPNVFNQPPGPSTSAPQPHPGQQPPGTDTSSFDDLEKRFAELRRKP